MFIQHWTPGETCGTLPASYGQARLELASRREVRMKVRGIGTASRNFYGSGTPFHASAPADAAHYYCEVRWRGCAATSAQSCGFRHGAARRGTRTGRQSGPQPPHSGGPFLDGDNLWQVLRL